MDFSGYRLVVFDKDGTLIDFDAMWGRWVEALAARLAQATGRAVATALYAAMGYDAQARRALPGGQLAVSSMSALRTLTGAVLLAQGVQREAAARALGAAWHVPDPAATARPLADLPRLFSALHERGLHVAVATSDDHAPTVSTLSSLGLMDLVDGVVAADDGVPPKPAPDMVWSACRSAGVEPRQAIVVGDGLADLQMGRAADAGLVVGVASGVSRAEQLAPCADLVLANVAELLA